MLGGQSRISQQQPALCGQPKLETPGVRDCSESRRNITGIFRKQDAANLILRTGSFCLDSTIATIPSAL
jgi:hypothetical protein